MNAETGNLIAELARYGVEKLGLCLEDAVYARNRLAELFGCVPGECGVSSVPLEETPDALVSRALESGLIKEGEELLFETKIMGLVTPSPGLVIKTYFDEARRAGSAAATSYLYELSVSNRYIRMKDIARNIRWYAEGSKGKVGITINLSKPEKDNKQVAAERNAAQVKYPKCLLCLENLGFCGTATHPARQTLRIVPVLLAGESWHMQFSPYMYYDEHVIVFSDEHRPMAVTDKTFRRLLDFVDEYPHYFLGSNADLPIVGGSILSHDHYQGGAKVLPMFRAEIGRLYQTGSELCVGIRDWYNSVVTVRGTDKERVIATCGKILSAWRGYSDESVGILSETDGVPHNTVTPIAIKSGEEYCVDLILRNNRTDEARPDGIFHPTSDMHNIKKEGIGLIEAMGMFILPGRLKKEIARMTEILSGESIDFAAIDADPSMSKHAGMIARIARESGMGLDENTLREKIIGYIDGVCLKILDCTAVFKSDKIGAEAFDRFMRAALG